MYAIRCPPRRTRAATKCEAISASVALSWITDAFARTLKDESAARLPLSSPGDKDG